jgi:putative selenium metabolism protein SsnA
MSTVITNATLVTRDEKNPFVADGAVAFEGATICAVGPTRELKERYGDAETIDAKGRLVMPGLINTHMHYYSTFARGIDFGQTRPATTFGEVLTGLWWRLDKMLAGDEVYLSAIGPMIDGVRNGVTSVIDHHASPFAVRGSLFAIADAAELIGVRSSLCYEVSDRDGERIAQEGIAENVEFARHCKELRSDMLKGLMGMHAQMTVSQHTLERVVEEAEGLGIGCHIHAAEGIEDVVDSLAKYDMRVIERLSRTRVLNERSLIVHCVQVTDDEIALLAQSGAAVVNNPESNMSNAVGCSPILRMMKAGVLVGMGTDGYCTDMTESLRAVHAIQKHEAHVPSVCWGEPHTMLFENNRAIMNRYLDGETGVIRPGAYADLVIVDYEPPTPLTAGTLASHILFGIQGRCVDTTIINGRTVMRGRELIGIDEEKLMADSRQRAAALWARI